MQKGGPLGTHCQPRPIGAVSACEAEQGHQNQLAGRPRWDGTATRSRAQWRPTRGFSKKFGSFHATGEGRAALACWSVVGSDQAPRHTLPNLH